MAFMRRRTVPDAVRNLALSRGERVLAWSLLAGSAGAAAATDRALHVVAPGGTKVLLWQDVLRAGWEVDTATIVVDVVVAPHGTRHERIALDGDGARLPETVRERVTSSIVLAQHVALRGRSGVRIVARRIPGSIELLWQLHPDAGIDLQEEEFAYRTEAALAELRASVTA